MYRLFAPIAALCCLFLSCSAGAQVKRNPDGIGILTPAFIPGDSLPNYQAFRLPVFSRPKGRKLGYLHRTDVSDTIAGATFFLKLRTDSVTGWSKLVHSSQTFTTTDQGGYYLQVLERVGGYVRVRLGNSMYWLREKDLDKLWFRFSAYTHALKRFRVAVIPYNQTLNLRDGPGSTFPVLVKAKGGDEGFNYTVHFTGEWNGPWARVEMVRSLGTHWPCPQEKLSPRGATRSIVRGWVRTVDESGAPTVWTYPESCPN